jgi:hypothetical protein
VVGNPLSKGTQPVRKPEDEKVEVLLAIVIN